MAAENFGCKGITGLADPLRMLSRPVRPCLCSLTVNLVCYVSHCPRALAGHVSRQMLERYSHIRSRAKQAAIQSLEEEAIAPVLEERRYNFRYSQQNEQDANEANSLKIDGGPARIRTWDQRIMSPLL